MKILTWHNLTLVRQGRFKGVSRYTSVVMSIHPWQQFSQGKIWSAQVKQYQCGPGASEVGMYNVASSYRETIAV